MSTKRYEFQITKDDYPENPRVEWDNVGTMLCTHPRYNLGDVENLSSADILEQIADELKIDLTQWHDGEKSEEDLYKEVMSHDENGVVLPLNLYDHSGISMSVGVKQGWDSGQVGFIFVSYDNLKKAGIDDKYLQEEYHSRFNSTIEKDFSTSQPLSSIQIDETMDVEKERAGLEQKVNAAQSQDVQQL